MHSVDVYFRSTKVECHQSAGFVSMLGEGNGDDDHDNNYFYWRGNALASSYPNTLVFLAYLQ